MYLRYFRQTFCMIYIFVRLFETVNAFTANPRRHVKPHSMPWHTSATARNCQTNSTNQNQYACLCKGARTGHILRLHALHIFKRVQYHHHHHHHHTITFTHITSSQHRRMRREKYLCVAFVDSAGVGVVRIVRLGRAGVLLLSLSLCVDWMSSLLGWICFVRVGLMPTKRLMVGTREQLGLCIVGRRTYTRFMCTLSACPRYQRFNSPVCLCICCANIASRRIPLGGEC